MLGKMRTEKEIVEMHGKIEQAQFEQMTDKRKHQFKKEISKDYVKGILHGLAFASGLADMEIFQKVKT